MIEGMILGLIHGVEFIFVALLVIVGVAIYIGLYYKVADMARERKRNASFWVLASLFKNPLQIMFLLKILGRSDDDDDEDEEEDY